MKKELEEGLVRWEPDWSPEERERIDEAKARFKQQIADFRVLRKALGMTQKELSELLFTSQSNVSKMERKGDPTLSMIRQIIEAKGGKLHVIAELEGRSIELNF